MRMMVEPRYLERSCCRNDRDEETREPARASRPGSSSEGECPEIARLGPLEGGPFEFRELPDDIDFALGRRLPADATNTAGVPYLSCFTLVRDALLRILAARDRPFETRLIAFMEVADRVSEYFDENSTSVDLEQLASDLEAADLEVGGGPRSREDQRYVDLMARRVARYYLCEYRADECRAQEYRTERSSRLGRLVDEVRLGYGRPVWRWNALTEGEALAACGGDGPEPSWRAAAPALHWDDETVLRAYRSRRALLLLSHGRRLERSFTNYCLNHLLVEHYIDWPNLRAYARDLALRVASVRFLLFSHPSVAAAWSSGTEGPESREVEGEAWTVQAVDRALAETLQCVGRDSGRVTCLEELRRFTHVDDISGSAGLVALVLV